MEPADSVTRYDTEREQVGQQRMFAAALIATGLQRVITVPVLPAALAASVLEVLTPALAKPEENSLTNAVARARGRILAWPAFAAAVQSQDPAFREGLKELAYDVCLFVGQEGSPDVRTRGDE
jgi:hypothetical protein